MAKTYNTVKDLLDMLEQDYDELTYCHIFAIVTDDDWTELEIATEKMIKENGELLDDLHDIGFDDEGCVTEEYLEIYGVED